MNNEEAIELLSNVNLQSPLAEALKLAVKSLKKQMPKKAQCDEVFHKTFYYTCPTCGNALLTKMMNERQNTRFCWDCGQALDWEEGEQE